MTGPQDRPIWCSTTDCFSRLTGKNRAEEECRNSEQLPLVLAFRGASCARVPSLSLFPSLAMPCSAPISHHFAGSCLKPSPGPPSWPPVPHLELSSTLLIYIYFQLLSQFTVPIGIFLCPWCWFPVLQRGKLFGGCREQTITQHSEPLLLPSLDRSPLRLSPAFTQGLHNFMPNKVYSEVL